MHCQHLHCQMLLPCHLTHQPPHDLWRFHGLHQPLQCPRHLLLMVPHTKRHPRSGNARGSTTCPTPDASNSNRLFHLCPQMSLALIAVARSSLRWRLPPPVGIHARSLLEWYQHWRQPQSPSNRRLRYQLRYNLDPIETKGWHRTSFRLPGQTVACALSHRQVE